LTKSDLVKFWI